MKIIKWFHQILFAILAMLTLAPNSIFFTGGDFHRLLDDEYYWLFQAGFGLVAFYLIWVLNLEKRKWALGEIFGLALLLAYFLPWLLFENVAGYYTAKTGHDSEYYQSIVQKKWIEERGRKKTKYYLVKHCSAQYGCATDKMSEKLFEQIQVNSVFTCKRRSSVLGYYIIDFRLESWLAIPPPVQPEKPVEFIPNDINFKK